jgi:hypothetical protein
MGRPRRIVLTDELTQLEDALEGLRRIRDDLRRMGARMAYKAVTRAMKSVDGAKRHAYGCYHRRLDPELQRLRSLETGGVE